LNEIDKRGFYQVGNQKFYRKVDAILEDQKTNIGVHWNFNDDVFGTFDWQSPVELSMKSLYGIRAKQLREKYDYLVLCYSGGIDSYTILRSFIDNNIFLDEILIFGPFKGTESTANSSDEAWNLRSEIELQAIPILKKLDINFNTKVTFYDYTDDLLKYYNNKNWILDFNPGVRYNASMPKNILIHNSTRNYLMQYDKGRRVGFIHGIDKPRVTFHDDSYYMYFLDVQLSISVGDFNQVNDLYWENDELFYWSPDLPEMLSKQAQIISAWFDLNPHLRNLLDFRSGKGLVPEEYYSIINPLVYQDYCKDIVFKVKKPYNPLYQENEYWFRNEDISAYKNWKTGLDDLKSQIAPTWCNQNTFEKGLIGCFSKFYKVK